MPEISSAFDRLDERVRRWIWDQKWEVLRDAQEQAIEPILSGTQDVIIAAATAAGKTEAAFLPIASSLLKSEEAGLALYLSPLKALINDQFLRIGSLFGSFELPVYPWHGDIGAKPKDDFGKRPYGALLITPESLEGIFVRKGFSVPHLFRHLKYIVVDELHSFIGSERGMQIASLMNRLEAAIGRRVPRIGLSATLGDLRIAAGYLRPGEAGAVRLIESRDAPKAIHILVKGYRDRSADAEDRLVLNRVAEDVFQSMRGRKNLVFANSRTAVEDFTDRTCRLCEVHRVPNEFYAHHGSLSKELREDVESILKDPSRVATAVCTSTLEMGIDIEAVESVGQLSPPFSVASLRQRLGRSGRREKPAVLRAFVIEPALSEDRRLNDQLRLDLVQTIATIELLLRRWCEPPEGGAMHLSTLVHQFLSLVAQRGGVRAEEAYQVLCRQGPFVLEVRKFTLLLRELARRRLIVQSEDGTLLHGEVGEKIVNHYSFYATFWSPEEFQLVHGTRRLGSLSTGQPVSKDVLILFGGRRWRVVNVDAVAHVIEVVPAQGGRAPHFTGGAPGSVHRLIHREMWETYGQGSVPAYLDEEARSLLREGRERYAAFGLHSARLVAVPGGTSLFLWSGDRVTNTLQVQLQADGFTTGTFGVGLMIEKIEPAALLTHLRGLARQGPPPAEVLAATVANQIRGKFDQYLPPGLLAECYGAAMLDPAAAWDVLNELLQSRDCPEK